MTTKIVFLIFEKSYLIRQGLISLVHEMNRCELADEYSDTLQFHSAIKMHKPQIVFINFDLMDNIPFKMAKNLKKEYNCIYIGINSKSVNPGIHFMDGFFNCNDEKTDLIKNLGNHFSSIWNEPKNKKQDNQLSEREKDIVVLAAKGLTNKEIASHLFISVHTAITHRRNISHKLGIKSVSGLTVYAILNKLIDMKDLY